MDPNANLSEMLNLAESLVDDENASDDAGRLAELVLAMHYWLQSGGFNPKLWDKK